jgi:hypothetical protein
VYDMSLPCFPRGEWICLCVDFQTEGMSWFALWLIGKIARKVGEEGYIEVVIDKRT